MFHRPPSVFGEHLYLQQAPRYCITRARAFMRQQPEARCCVDPPTCTSFMLTRCILSTGNIVVRKRGTDRAMKRREQAKASSNDATQTICAVKGQRERKSVNESTNDLPINLRRITTISISKCILPNTPLTGRYFFRSTGVTFSET